MVIPDIDEAHYNVIDVMIDNNSKNFIPKCVSLTKWQVQQQVARKKDYSCTYQRIHCKPSRSIQQILSQTKKEMFMPVEESFTM